MSTYEVTKVQAYYRSLRQKTWTQNERVQLLMGVLAGETIPNYGKKAAIAALRLKHPHSYQLFVRRQREAVHVRAS